jgi:putative ubiquitin-RnfH superfamily antitoxin RatB of RatAB toxin-antitoxin module
MAKIRVEVVRAVPGSHECVGVSLPAGATVGDAVRASGLGGEGKYGVFGKPRRADDPLADGDRVEIYRPLVVDPKEARRRRARRR